MPNNKKKAKSKAKKKATASNWAIVISNCVGTSTHGKRKDKVTFSDNDPNTTYRVTWTNGSPFTKYLKPGAYFDVAAGTPKTVTIDPNANYTPGYNDYKYTLAKSIDGGVTFVACPARTVLGGGGGGDVIVDQ